MMQNTVIRFGIIGTNVITENFIKGATLCPQFQLTAVYSRTEEKGRAFANKFGVRAVFTNLEDLLKVIRFGIIGTNVITENFIKGATLCPQFQLTAVYSRTEEKGRAFANKFGVRAVFTNLEDLLKSGLVDAMYIASPNAFHATQTIQCLNHGKHVLCEKTFASNLQEVEQMCAVAKENNVVLMEAMKTTVLPSFQLIKDHLYKIGKVRRYFASFCQYSSRNVCCC